MAKKKNPAPKDPMAEMSVEEIQSKQDALKAKYGEVRMAMDEAQARHVQLEQIAAELAANIKFGEQELKKRGADQS